MYLDKLRNGQVGAHMLQPLITEEDEELSPESRKGIIVNRGYTPKNYLSKILRI